MSELEKPILYFRNESPNELPGYADSGSSGLDIRAWIDDGTNNIAVIPSGERLLVHTGIYANIPEGYELQVRSRSGLTLKSGLIVANEPGTIDESYTGEICVILYNIDKVLHSISTGDRIAQLVMAKVEHPKIVEIKEITKTTTRGSGGFGHTGKD
jgi:dUTP pyrophosphatase